MQSNNSTDYIEHSAIVISINPSNSSVKVRIYDEDNCGECPASTLCGNANGKNSNVVDIPVARISNYKKGDIVTVRGTEKMHHKAILYATVLPCIILIAVMVTVYIITLNQLLSALTGVGVMVLFFVFLWLCRNKIAHEFTFGIVGKPERAGEQK